MTMERLLLLLGAAGLLAPVPLLFSRKRRYRSLHQLDIERRNGSRWAMLTLILRFAGHWLEFARAVLASWCVAATISQLAPISPLYATHAAWAGAVLPLALGALSVTVVELLFRYPGKSIAPVAFVAGTLLVLLPPAISLPALVFGGFCALALRSLSAFFFALAPVLVLLGFLLHPHPWPALAGGLLAILPPVLAASRHHEFVIPVRRPRSD